jgi:hypothetical protein
MKSFPPYIVIILVAAGVMMCNPRLMASEPWMSRLNLGALFHPLQKPDGVPAPACAVDQAGSCCKDHVYIFAVNGMDPFCLGNLNGLCEYLREQGFANTNFAQLHTCAGFSSRMRQIRQDDPEARIVLIGFSCGCNVAKGITNSLNKDGTRIDLLVYLAGDYITNSPSSFPSNVCSVLNIRGKGYLLSGGSLFFCGADIDGARNCTLTSRHMLAPSRQETLELLMEEILPLTCPLKSAAPVKTALAKTQNAIQPTVHTVQKADTLGDLTQTSDQQMTDAVHKEPTLAALAQGAVPSGKPAVRAVQNTNHAEPSSAGLLRIP